MHVIDGFGSRKARFIQETPEGMVGSTFSEIMGLNTRLLVHNHGLLHANLVYKGQAQCAQNSQEHKNRNVANAGF